MRKYCLDNPQEFIDRYIAAGGEIVDSCEGCLGWGTMILQGKGLKNFVLDEEYLNEWSSMMVLYDYGSKPIPKKWFRAIEEANTGKQNSHGKVH